MTTIITRTWKPYDPNYHAWCPLRLPHKCPSAPCFPNCGDIEVDPRRWGKQLEARHQRQNQLSSFPSRHRSPQLENNCTSCVRPVVSASIQCLSNTTGLGQCLVRIASHHLQNSFWFSWRGSASISRLKHVSLKPEGIRPFWRQKWIPLLKSYLKRYDMLGFL